MPLDAARPESPDNMELVCEAATPRVIRLQLRYQGGYRLIVLRSALPDGPKLA
jgi:hypothetical protein